LPIFASLYEKNANVFAAIPSLHSAYPVILLYYGSKLKRPRLNILFIFFMLGIWFSAVYSGHHYIIDVILGALCAVLGIAVYEVVSRWISKNKSKASP
jgi:membrane-associated phospholipid phosphatase